MLGFSRQACPVACAGLTQNKMDFMSRGYRGKHGSCVHEKSWCISSQTQLFLISVRAAHRNDTWALCSSPLDGSCPSLFSIYRLEITNLSLFGLLFLGAETEYFFITFRISVVIFGWETFLQGSNSYFWKSFTSKWGKWFGEFHMSVIILLNIADNRRESRKELVGSGVGRASCRLK